MLTVHFTDEVIVAGGKLFRSSSLRCAISGAQMSLLCRVKVAAVVVVVLVVVVVVVVSSCGVGGSSDGGSNVAVVVLVGGGGGSSSSSNGSEGFRNGRLRYLDNYSSIVLLLSLSSSSRMPKYKLCALR